MCEGALSAVFTGCFKGACFHFVIRCWHVTLIVLGRPDVTILHWGCDANVGWNTPLCQWALTPMITYTWYSPLLDHFITHEKPSCADQALVPITDTQIHQRLGFPPCSFSNYIIFYEAKSAAVLFWGQELLQNKQAAKTMEKVVHVALEVDMAQQGSIAASISQWPTFSTCITL